MVFPAILAAPAVIGGLSGLGGMAAGWLLSGDDTEVQVQPGATYAASPASGIPWGMIAIAGVGVIGLMMFMRR